MARKKKLTRPTPTLEKEYWDEIEVYDPNTGKTTTQKIKVQRFKTISVKDVGPQEEDIIATLNNSKTFTYDDE